MRIHLFILGSLLIAPLFVANAARAKVKSDVVTWKDGDVVLEGAIAYDDAVKEKRPGILVVPDWMGMSPYWQKKAEDLAALGYVALAVDVYGKKSRPKDQGEAGKLAGQYKGDRNLLRRRMKVAFDKLLSDTHVDPTKTAAIGFCFGGTSALELARAGTNLTGVVTFHGGLETPMPADAKTFKPKVLALHGADDPFVKQTEVSAFMDEMRSAKADWQLVQYANAVHSFTIPTAGNDNSKGAAYNAEADKRSWRAMRDFFDEIFNATGAAVSK